MNSIMYYHNFNLSIIIICSILLQFINCFEEPELDKNFYNNTFYAEELHKFNLEQNTECDIENKELYSYTDHNFNEPKSVQTIANAGFYPSIVFINQEIEFVQDNVTQHKISTCLGTILNDYFVLTSTRCLQKTKLRTVIRYGAISNNCTGCPITVAKNITSEQGVSLIYLKYPIKFSRDKAYRSELSQSVGPACDNIEQSNKHFNFKTWLIHLSHGLNEKRLDYLYQKPTKINQRSKYLITISNKQDKIISESFLFKKDNEKLYLIGLCDLRKYLNYYCFNINKYKKFIKDTINSLRSADETSLELVNTHWNKDNKVFRTLNRDC